ncbi:MAG: MFS transporter [Limisphaerales bacterium]
MRPTGSSETKPLGQTETLPTAVRPIYAFIIFNALSYQIILSSPMVLYAKTLGASATVLGILAGMMPLLVIFQIPAAKHLGRIGYKKFVFAGWGTRTLFVLGLALVPLTGAFLDRTTRLALVLLLLFAFNLTRGITSCAWLPWITALIPATVRGQYLVRDAACMNIGSFLVFVVAAVVLETDPHAWQFALLFAFSAAMAGISLSFLRRVPDGEAPAEIQASRTPVPWKEIISYPPFSKLVWMAIAWSVTYGGLTTFIVAFLKTETGLSEREIMLVTSVSFVGGLSSLWLLGSRLDHLGSKPVLAVCMITWIVILTGWILISGKFVTSHIIPLVLVLELAMGLGYSLVNMASTRLAMVVIPPMGRNHFFTYYSVVTNVTLGLAPIFWGIFIDALKGFHGHWHGLEWNRFSLFFAAAGLVYFVTLILTKRLHEPKAASMEELLRDIWQQSPLRIWFRLGPRG